MAGSAGTKLGVDIGETACDQPHSVAVHHEMVVARIPEEPTLRCLEQSKAKKRPTRGINWESEIGLHPRFRDGSRVNLRADVEDRHRPRRRRVQNLPRFASDEFDVQRLSFAYNLSQRPFKQYGIDGSQNLDVFSNIIRRTGRIDLLGQPDTALCSGQRKDIIINVSVFTGFFNAITRRTIEYGHWVEDPVVTAIPGGSAGFCLQ